MTASAVHVLIPVKAFARAKARLAPVLADSEREQLARTLATGVVHAAAAFATWVVCDDRTVADWARALDVGVSWQTGPGLNAAVDAAVRERFTSGAARVVVVHGDLPLVSSIDPLLGDPDELIVAPDRHGLGTNALSTTSPDFTFSFGAGSFARHLAEGRRLGLRTTIITEPGFGLDIDEPEDLELLSRHGRSPASRPI